MLDPHSPTWASDHRGIIADFQLQLNNSCVDSNELENNNEIKCRDKL